MPRFPLDIGIPDCATQLMLDRFYKQISLLPMNCCNRNEEITEFAAYFIRIHVKQTYFQEKPGSAVCALHLT